VVIYKAWKNAI